MIHTFKLLAILMSMNFSVKINVCPLYNCVSADVSAVAFLAEADSSNDMPQRLL